MAEHVCSAPIGECGCERDRQLASVSTTGDRVGGACRNRLIDHHGHNEGCRGRLVVMRATQFAPGRYRDNPNGEVELLVCPRCGQSHGRLIRAAS